MMKSMNQLFFFVLIAGLTTGCVSMRKYEDLQLSKSALQVKYEGIEEEVRELRNANRDLKAQLADRTAEYQEAAENLATERQRLPRVRNYWKKVQPK